MSDDDNYGSEEEYEYQYSDEDDDNSSSQPMAIDSDVDDASDGSRKRKAGTAGSNGGGAADSRRRSGSNVHNAMMELIDGGGGELSLSVFGVRFFCVAAVLLLLVASRQEVQVGPGCCLHYLFALGFRSPSTSGRGVPYRADRELRWRFLSWVDRG